MAVKNGVSDIHLRSGEQPYFRIKGVLSPIKANQFTEEDLITISKIIIKDDVLVDIKNLKEYDGSYQYENHCRVRASILRYQGRTAIVMRVVTMEIPTLDSLNLPLAVKKITNAKRGLVLVTGVTGSGKSSTLAGMLQEINNKRYEHILTIEDPVEFLFTSNKCRITQREIGSDTDGFSTALRSALRQHPDIIVICELRDASTIQIALEAAETGHLVFGTVHTTNAASTINRVISMFDSEEQENIKQRLSDCLHATISQRLLPSPDKKSRVCALEIMVNNIATKECILGVEPLANIYPTIERAKGIMQSFDQHLMDLYKKEKITLEVALDASSSPSNFERNLEFMDD